MKRLLLFIAIVAIASPARAQLFSAPMTPTPPAVNLGAGVPNALANPPNANGGVTLLSGPAAQGNCLAWGANGIQDAGSPCLTAPTIGMTNITGAGAPVATTLANRATDSGVTFNLKNDFGAKCDGATDDTSAIQNWLNKAAPNVQLIAPAGICNFSLPLTVPQASQFTLQGAGKRSTDFHYTGTSTTATLLTVNAPNAAVVNAVTIKDFRISTATTMTGGFAFQANGLFASLVEDVVLDGNSAGASSGKLCGGYWFNGAGGIELRNPDAFSLQNCGDGVALNGNLGGNAGLRIFGGSVGGTVSNNVNTGFANGFHMAGNMGGLECTQTNVHNNVVGYLIDDATVAVGNRDMQIHCTFDTSQNDGILINDPLSSGENIDLDGWVASTQGATSGTSGSDAYGINVVSLPSGYVNLRGNVVYNNCGDGLYSQDVTTNFLFNSATLFENNGVNSSAICTAWKANNPGHGYGVKSSSLSSNNRGMISGLGNSAGVQGNFIGLSTVGGSLLASQYVTGGGSPSISGTCSGSVGAQHGGTSAGNITATSACTGTLILTISNNKAPNGQHCSMYDKGTPTNLWTVTASSAGAVTFSGTMANADVLDWGCQPY